MFPEWPRAICGYLAEVVKKELENYIFEDETLSEIVRRTGKSKEDLIIRECVSCHRPAIKKELVVWICDSCNKLGELIKLDNKRVPKCPECREVLVEQRREDVFFCNYCDIRSDKNPELFEKKDKFVSNKLIDADLILVAPRHLFRMPYSLHEKTALASIVIDSDKIKDFQITDARPLKVKVRDFYPEVVEGEAKDLLLQGLDWQEQRDKRENEMKDKKENVVRLDNVPKKKGDFQKVVIEEPPVEIFPPHIKNLLKGVGQDGRKRALFILMSFFSSLGAKENYIEKMINEWNDRNYLPLKKGYIQSQFSWYRRNPNRLPPNFDNAIYKELGVEGIDDLVKQTKNPVSYAVKKWFMIGGRGWMF